MKFFTRTFPEYSITKKCPNRMIAFIRESNVLVKNFDGKHQQSLVKSPAKSCNFTERKEYVPLVSWFLSSAKFWPNIRSDPARFKFKRRQIPERQDSRKYLDIRFNLYEVEWNSVYLSCYEKRKKITRYRGVRVSCLMLRDVVLIGC